MIVNKRSAFVTMLSVALFWAGTALAGITDTISNLVSPESAYAGFLGTWTNPDKGLSDIDHIVIATSGSDQVRVQTFGRCGSQICNWGSLLGHVRSDNPQSAVVRSISVDYNLGFALRHITLRRAQGNMLRFDAVTEYTDGSARHDYETAGRLVPLGARPVASAAPVSIPAATGAPAASSAPAATGAPATPAAPATTDTFAEEVMPVAPAADVASAAPAPTKPWWDVLSVTQAPTERTAGGPGDCIVFDTEHSYLVPEAGSWKVRDFLHTIQDFGPYRNAANRALAIIAYYRLDEVCRIGRGSSNLAFYRATGEVPHTTMPGEDCVDVHPDKVEAAVRDDDWMVVDGSREIYNYGSDKDSAQQATAVIKALGFNRQCYFDRSNTPLSYWLSR
jgi:hypothetical protein